jgi:hypothetical protein
VVHWKRGCPSGREDVGGAFVLVLDLDPGFLQDLADDRGPVGFVHVEGLAGPFPGDQDASAAEAEVFAVVGL